MDVTPDHGWSVEHYGFEDPPGDEGVSTARTPSGRRGVRRSRRPRVRVLAASVTLGLASIVGVAGVAVADPGPSATHGHVRDGAGPDSHAGVSGDGHH